MQNKLTVIGLLAGLVVAIPFGGLTQTEEPETVINELHSFEFVVRENSVVTYETGGNGFSAVYNSKGGGKGTQPDYGLIVYGTKSHKFSSAEAKSAGFAPAVETTVTSSRFADQSAWQLAYSAQMAEHGRSQSGLAEVNLSDGSVLEVPFYSWSVSVGLRKAHALTYVVIHDDSFVHVQVESAQALNPGEVEWLTTNLVLSAVESDELSSN